MAPSTLTPALFHPRYWLTWLGIGLAWLLSWLPIPVLMTLGSGLGLLAGRLLKRRRHIVLTNLRIAFPALSPAQLEQRASTHFADIGKGLFEAALAWFAPDWRLRRLGHVEGLEHLHAAMADGSGVLLLTGHFTTLELGARFLCLAGVPFHAMYRPYGNAVMDFWMHRWRARRSRLPALPREDLRGLVRALRQGRAIWYAPDQTLDRRLSVYAPFFGVEVSTITATARLAQMGRAKVVPYFPRRVRGRYIVRCWPALKAFPSNDELADATRVNQVIEYGIGLAPSQYFWIHRRYKVLPPGTPSVY